MQLYCSKLQNTQAGFIGMSLMLLSFFILSTLLLLRNDIVAESSLEQQRMQALQLEYQVRTAFIDELSSRVQVPSSTLQEHEQKLQFNMRLISRLLEFSYKKGLPNTILNLAEVFELIPQQRNCPIASAAQRTRSSIKTCKLNRINHSQIIFGNLITENFVIEGNLSIIILGETRIGQLQLQGDSIQIISFADVSIDQISSVSSSATLYLDALRGDIKLPEQFDSNEANPNPLTPKINARALRGRVLFGGITRPNALFAARTAQYWRHYLTTGWRITAN